MSARIKDRKWVTVLPTLRLYSNRHVKLETNRETLDNFGSVSARKGKGKKVVMGMRKADLCSSRGRVKSETRIEGEGKAVLRTVHLELT